MGDHEQKTGGRLRELTAMLGARAKKAYSAGIAGAALAIGGISVAGFWADGKVDTGKVAAAAGTIVVGFISGFLAAFLPRNAVSATVQEDSGVMRVEGQNTVQGELHISGHTKVEGAP